MPRAYIISTGTELLYDGKKDSNADYLSAELIEMGFEISGRTTVGDEKSSLVRAFATGLEQADMVISSGGLGPTFDDLTRDAAAQAAGLELFYNANAAEAIGAFFQQLGRPMPESARVQAMFPPGAKVLENREGTAPGTFVASGGKIMVLLPGPPREMKAMFESEVKPLLLARYKGALHQLFKRPVRIFGLGESQVEERVADLLDQAPQIKKAILASNTEVMIKLSTGDESQTVSMNELAQRIAVRLPGYAYSFHGEDSLASIVIQRLKERRASLALAESCTGGLEARMLTDIPGASDVFWGAVVSYSNQAKISCLQVREQTLERYGAVSENTALEMARGIRNLSTADWVLSTTGIAGPGGGSPEKPVGLVYIACIGPDRELVKRFQFGGGRERIRNLAARSALSMLLRQLPGKMEM